MASPRLLADPSAPVACYHVHSRVVDRRFILGDEEREFMVRLMRRYEAFCQLRIMAQCVMSDHFHLLLEVKPRPANRTFSDDWVIRHLRLVTSPERWRVFAFTLRTLRKQGAHAEADRQKEAVLRRMWNLSEFMKEFKQAFSTWYNRRNKRHGTLWEERFGSHPVEPGSPAMCAIAAYIDLNPIRAKMVEDPKDYRWCSYGAAMGGYKPARDRLCEIFSQMGGREPGQDVMEFYRMLLFAQGEEQVDEAQGITLRKGVSREAAAKVLREQGVLTRAAVLRHRIRYFTRGAALGSRAFVESIFEANRHRFGPKRKTGARPLRGTGLKGIYCLRALKKPIGHDMR